jgi:LCP family protein required for cell wall assembly
VTAADPWANVSRVNMLLIGSDYAPHSDRIGVRTDSIEVASIDTKTGNTVLFGLPRNLENVPFPASDPLSKVWPNGFSCPNGVCLLNAIWQQGELHKDLFPNHGKDAGIIATRDAVSNVLGIKLDYYTVIDLTGFQGLVNAMGGVYVNVNERLPIGGAHNGEGQVIQQPTSYISPGKHKKLTGYYALWFARSRFSTDDYDRMRRQRCLISDIVSQANPVKMLQKYPALAAVAKSNIATNIPAKDLPAWVTLIERMQKGTITSLPFTSAVVNTSNPDFPHIRQLVAKAIRNASATSTSTATSGSSATAGGTSKSKGKASSTSVDVSNVC